MNLLGRRRHVGRALGCLALSSALAACGVAAPAPSPSVPTFTLMQMNLCLSGAAGCYAQAAYPSGVEEAVARIQEVRPDAVTVNEVCRRDATRIARSTGYHVRFARVIYAGAPFPCLDPGGRGLFGHALLTTARIAAAESEAFAAQADLEVRRWLCATTADLDVCTAHLETPHTSAAAAARDAQCAELAAVLEARRSPALVFGGDLNRRDACAPPGAWIRTDSDGRQAPGVQHVYGNAALQDPVAGVLPAAFSDHGVLVVHATLAPR